MAHSRVQCKICTRKMRSDHLKRHMKTHENGLNWAKENPTFNGSEFGTETPKSKETRQFDQIDRPAKIARMEQTSKVKLPDVLEEIVKPKSLIELYMNGDDADEDDHGDDTYEDDDGKNDHNNLNQESQSVIQSTTSFIIKNDKEELDKLIDEFKSEAGVILLTLF